MATIDALVEAAEASVSDAILNDHYDGTQQLDAVGISIPPRVRALEVVVNWPRLVVDTMAEVLSVIGFESAALDDEAIQQLWDTWQACNMDTLSHTIHVEALTQGEAFAVVGLREDGSIRTTAHTKDGIAVRQTSDGEILEAMVVFEEDTEDGSRVKKAVHYTPETTATYQQVAGMWGQVSSAPGIGIVPVIPFRNVERITDVNGRSDMQAAIPFGNAASRSFTLLQLATEILTMPQRYIAGGDQSKFKTADGEQKTLAEIYLGSIMFAPSSDAKFGQFAGADLSQIIATIKASAGQLSAFYGIPLSMLGVSSEGNPESAEAMRVAKERMLTRGERKQDAFGDGWERWALLVLALSGRQVSPHERINSVWADIAVPSAAAKTASLLQAHAQGVVSARTARDGLPLTPEQRAREDQAEGVTVVEGAADEIIDPGTFVDPTPDAEVADRDEV